MTGLTFMTTSLLCFFIQVFSRGFTQFISSEMHFVPMKKNYMVIVKCLLYDLEQQVLVYVFF